MHEVGSHRGTSSICTGFVQLVIKEIVLYKILNCLNTEFVYQVSIDAKSVLALEKYPLVAELKLKCYKKADILHFQIQVCPQKEGTFQMLVYFKHLSCLWTLGQKKDIQIFERQTC